MYAPVRLGMKVGAERRVYFAALSSLYEYSIIILALVYSLQTKKFGTTDFSAYKICLYRLTAACLRETGRLNLQHCAEKANSALNDSNGIKICNTANCWKTCNGQIQETKNDGLFIPGNLSVNYVNEIGGNPQLLILNWDTIDGALFYAVEYEQKQQNGQKLQFRSAYNSMVTSSTELPFKKSGVCAQYSFRVVGVKEDEVMYTSVIESPAEFHKALGFRFRDFRTFPTTMDKYKMNYPSMLQYDKSSYILTFPPNKFSTMTLAPYIHFRNDLYVKHPIRLSTEMGLRRQGLALKFKGSFLQDRSNKMILATNISKLCKENDEPDPYPLNVGINVTFLDPPDNKTCQEIWEGSVAIKYK